MENLVFSNYTFQGKHAKFAQDLVGDNSTSYFSSKIRLFISGALIGISKNLKGQREQGEPRLKIEKDTWMLANAQIQHIMCLAIINDKDSSEPLDSRLKRLYTSPETPDEFRELLESYALGGIEYIHENLWFAGANTIEKIGQMGSFINSLTLDNEEISATEIFEKANNLIHS